MPVRGRRGRLTVDEAVRPAARRWPGRGEERLYLGHATGFCKEVWGPVVDELREAGVTSPVTAWDFRGHGDSPDPVSPCDWWNFARDVLAVVGGEEPGPRVGLGHSSGASALAMAEVLEPGTFRRLVLVEPIVFPPPYRRHEDSPMARRAERRRASFQSPEAALANFRDKRVFSGWDPRALAAYVEGALERREGAWWLKCRPEVEAEVYRAATAHGAWDRLGEVEVPVLVLVGEHSESHPREVADALAARFPDARVETVPGTGHFLPMERPDLLAAAVASGC